MMRICSLVFLILFGSLAYAQLADANLGARQSAIGGASVTIADHWSIVNNVGSLSRYKKTAASATYISRFGLEELSTVAFAGSHHLKNIGTFGLTASRYGDLLSQQFAGLGFSNQFGLVSLGVSINYYQLRISTLGKSSAAVINIGGVAEVTPKLFFGAHVYNLNQGELNSPASLSLPVIMKSGVSYRPEEDLMVNLEVEKELESEVIYKFGVEYYIRKMFIVRTGFRTNPFVATGGLGIKYRQLVLDYAYGDRSLVGAIHEITVGYEIGK